VGGVGWGGGKRGGGFEGVGGGWEGGFGEGGVGVGGVRLGFVAAFGLVRSMVEVRVVGRVIYSCHEQPRTFQLVSCLTAKLVVRTRCSTNAA